MLSYRIRPNAQLPEWPNIKDFNAKSFPSAKEAARAYDRACEQVQKTVPWYGVPMDTCLDWRRMVLDVKARATHVHMRLDGIIEETMPYVEGCCPEITVPILVRPRYRYGDFKPWLVDRIYRHVYLTFEVVRY